MIENPVYYVDQYIKVIHNSEEIIVRILNVEDTAADKRRRYFVMVEGSRQGFFVDDSEIVAYLDAVSQVWCKTER